MPANMTGPPVLPVLLVTRVVHGVSVAGRYGPVIQIGDPSLIPLYTVQRLIRIMPYKNGRPSGAENLPGSPKNA